MQAKIKYDFSGKIWKYGSVRGWNFLSLSKEISKEIRENLKWQEEGWGRMKAPTIVKGFEWDCAIWFDKKLETYLLPLKAVIRKKASLKLDERITVSISI